MSLLAAEVRALADALLGLPDVTLAQDWPRAPADDGWRDYSDTLSDIVYLIYQKLRAFTVTVQSDRAAHGPAMSSAQHILGQHQLAYREFHGVMAGVGDEELDLTPFETKWSLRSNLAHIVFAECWSQGPQVLHALERRRAGREPTPISPRDSLTESGAPVDYGSLAELLADFDSRHDNLIRGLADITEEELDTPSIYWEDEPVSVGFRLYRFAWHLRSHTLQADKIRIGLGHRT